MVSGPDDSFVARYADVFSGYANIAVGRFQDLVANVASDGDLKPLVSEHTQLQGRINILRADLLHIYEDIAAGGRLKGECDIEREL